MKNDYIELSALAPFETTVLPYSKDRILVVDKNNNPFVTTYGEDAPRRAELIRDALNAFFE